LLSKEVVALAAEGVSVTFEHVSFTYTGSPAAGFLAAPQGQTLALCDINLQVAPGEIVLIVGAPGSGKSTLLAQLTPELLPAGTAAGQVLVDGVPLEALAPRERVATVARIQALPQRSFAAARVDAEVAFTPEALGLPAQAVALRCAEALTYVDATRLAARELTTLSQGEAQLTAIAAALAAHPKLLVADEPTASLAPAATRSTVSMLATLAKTLGITVLVATHNPAPWAGFATSAYRMEAGTLAPVAVASLALTPAEKRRAIEPPTSSGAQSAPHGAPPRPVEEGSKLMGFSAYPEVAKTRGAAGAPTMQLKDVWARWDAHEPWTLAGVDTTYAKGEVVACVGANGSGKSSLLAVLAGVLKPRHGKARRPWAQAQAYMAQDPYAGLMYPQVGEVLRAAAPGTAQQHVTATLERLGMAHLEAAYLDELSLGQVALVNVARTLATQPQLYLLDEPTAFLDAAARGRVAAALEEEAAHGACVVVATHDLAFIEQVATRVDVLLNAQVVASLTTSEFLDQTWFF
jgi:energy-coupling factor transport system ATP-binding protein